MDKMTVNMIAGAVLSALLVIFGMNTFIDIVYPRGGGPQAPVEHASTAPADAAPAEAAQPLGVLLAGASVEAGAGAAKKCVACHSFEQGGANKIGPNLHGIVGRPVASHEGFAYSAALKGFGGNWDYEKLSCFILNPKSCVPGNKMAFAGLGQDKERANVIAYLRSVSPDAPPLPAAEAAPAAPPAAAEAGAAQPAQDAPAPGAPAAGTTQPAPPAQAGAAQPAPAPAAPAPAAPAEANAAQPAPPVQN